LPEHRKSYETQTSQGNVTNKAYDLIYGLQNVKALSGTKTTHICTEWLHP